MIIDIREEGLYIFVNITLDHYRSFLKRRSVDPVWNRQTN